MAGWYEPDVKQNQELSTVGEKDELKSSMRLIWHK
jgi:hypothetical protein